MGANRKQDPARLRIAKAILLTQNSKRQFYQLFLIMSGKERKEPFRK